MMLYRQVLVALTFVLSAVVLSACGGGGGEGEGSSQDTSGDSANGDNNNGNVSGNDEGTSWPASIVGDRIELTVVENTSSGLPVGQTIAFDFSPEGKVRGTNLSTGQVLTPTSYTYTPSGDSARIRINYDADGFGGGTGYEDYSLRASGSVFQGSYEYDAEATDDAQAAGNYRFILASAYLVEVDGTEPISGPRLQSFEHLRFQEGLLDVTLHHIYYIALLQDGSINSYSTRERLPAPCYSSTCPPGETWTNPVLLSPSGNDFVAISSPSRLFGYALNSGGELIYWGGETGQTPKVAEFAGGGRVRALANGFRYPPHVLMEDGTVRVPLCLPLPGFECRTADTALQQHRSVFPGVSNSRYLYNNWNILQSPYVISSLIVDASGTVHRHRKIGEAYESQVTPTGQPAISLVKGDKKLIVAQSTQGELSAWNSEDLRSVTLPETEAHAIADFEVEQTGSEPDRYHIALVTDTGAGLLWAFDANLELVSSTQVRDPGTVQSVVTSKTDAVRFVFIR